MCAHAMGLCRHRSRPFRLGVRRLGERTCVVNIGTDLRRSEAPRQSLRPPAQAAADGCRDFVFDLTYSAATSASRSAGWPTSGPGSATRAATSSWPPASPAWCATSASCSTDDGWTLLPSATKALRALLSKPVA